VRGSRDLREGLALFLELEGMDSRSNDVFLEYTDLAISAGVRWSR